MKQKESSKKASFFTNLVPVARFSEGTNSEIEIVKAGYWNHPSYGELIINDEALNEFINNFNVRSHGSEGIPITVGHPGDGEELPAVGWIKNVFKTIVDGVPTIKGMVEWTDKGLALIKEEAFKFFSPEWQEDYNDPETRVDLGHTLIAGALTNFPYFKGLAPVTFSENFIGFMASEQKGGVKKQMSKEELKAKYLEDKNFVPESDEDKKLLDEVKTEAEAEQKAKDEAEAKVKADAEAAVKVEEDEAKKKADAEAADKAEKAENKEGDSQEDKDKIASEKKDVTVTFDEFNSMKKAMETLKELRKEQVKGSIEKYTFSEKSKEGLFTPATKDRVVNFVFSLPERMQGEFMSILEDMTKVRTTLFDELGKGGKNDDDTTELRTDQQMNKLAQEIQATAKAAGKEVSYKEAAVQAEKEMKAK